MKKCICNDNNHIGYGIDEYDLKKLSSYSYLDSDPTKMWQYCKISEKYYYVKK